MRKFIPLTLVMFTFLSCNNPTCTDGIQNGNETGVDCGGSCPACVPNPTAQEQSIKGKWKLYAYNSNSTGCNIIIDTIGYAIDFTLNPAAPPNQDKYESLGLIAAAAYPSIYPWYLSSSNLINNQYNYSISNDTLYLKSTVGQEYIYYKDSGFPTANMDITLELSLNSTFSVDSVIQILTPTGQHYLLAGQSNWSENLLLPVNTSTSASMTVMLGPNYSNLGSDQIITYKFRIIDDIGNVLSTSGDLTECVPGGGGSGCGGSAILQSHTITLGFLN